MKKAVIPAKAGIQSLNLFQKKHSKTWTPAFAGVTTLLLTLLFSFPSYALKTGGHVKATLVSEVSSIKPGVPFWVAVRLEMEGKWHTYWKNAGESGAPTQIEWKLPPGFKAGPIEWPAPEVIALPPVLSYGYMHEVLLLVQITPDASVTAGTAKLAAQVDWLECDVTCIPGAAAVALTLPVRNAPPAPNNEWQEKFSQTRFQWPLEKSDWAVQVFDRKTHYQISLTPPAGESAKLSDLTFFAEEPGVIQYAAPQKLGKQGPAYTLDLVKSESSTFTAKQLFGVLVTSNGWRGPSSEKALGIAVPIESGGAVPANSISFLAALGLAFLGGLILNLMPCVLPVLSIKILGFVKQAQEDPRQVFMHGLVFAGGVVVSFWVLAGALLFLRAGGAQLGWGFQLQSPVFVGVLAALFFVLGLNLFGVFEIGTSLTQLADYSRGKTGYASSFFNGVLATIVATPCTAPFMGSALGFALTQPPLHSILIFTSLALGMASPYVVLSANPGFLKFVPKPGPWMNTFKKIMGALFMATVLWLVWVLNTQVQFIKFGANTTSSEKINWEPYSEQRVNEIRSKGQAVFVDFTAAWCLTCQVNERVTLNSSAVVAAFKNKNIAPLKADWTSRDATIAKKLEEFGRSGVPFYVIYPADPEKPPVTLPEIITPQIVINKLEEL